jgi:hypothetical protein
MTVAQMQDLRAKLRDVGGSVRVAKNTLAKIALEGKPAAKMGDLLTGMTVLSFSEDPVAAAKVCEAYAKTNDKFVIIGGAMGDTVLDQAGVKAVASMPSREELIAQIVVVHRGAGLCRRRCHWRACFEHRKHPVDHRGKGSRLTTFHPGVVDTAPLEPILTNGT